MERKRIDERGGEFNEIFKLGAEIEKYLPEEILEVRRKGRKAVVWVLSGGGALAPAHIGAFGAGLESGIPCDLIIGTSAGAIGAMAASRAKNLNDWLRSKQIAEEVGWSRLRRKAKIDEGGLWALNGMPDFIDGYIGEFEDPDWKPKPVLITMVDIDRVPKALRIQWAPMEGTTWGQMVQASCSIPVYMTPTRVNGFRLWDGGAVSKEGYEPIDVAKVIVPEALIISVRLAFAGVKKFAPRFAPDIRIEPCLRERSGVFDQIRFDKEDVKRGYLAGEAMVAKIWEKMNERGINPEYRPGFMNRAQLMAYFGLV